MSCNFGISACEKAGLWEASLALLRDMPAMRLKSDAVSYAAGISACYKGPRESDGGDARWQVALALLQEMCSTRLDPDTITYNACISACEKNDQWRSALELFHAMTVVALARDKISYS